MPDKTIVTYIDETGKAASIEYVRAQRPLSDVREKYAQLIAYGNVTQIEAYCEAYSKTPSTELEWKSAAECASRTAHDTDVILRVQELRKPLVRKLRRKFEYTIQKALEQCETAWELAYATGDAKSMLAAIRMQAELGKLLSQQINVDHRYGVLDDTSTEVLLALRNEFAVRQEKAKKLKQIEARDVETVQGDPHAPSFVVE